jgi:hypothetical protein
MSWFQKLLPPKIKRKESRTRRIMEQVRFLRGGTVLLGPGKQPQRLPQVQSPQSHFRPRTA